MGVYTFWVVATLLLSLGCIVLGSIWYLVALISNKRIKIAGIIVQFGIWGIPIIFVASITLLMLGEKISPKERAEIIVEETLVVEKRVRTGVFYHCEITDEKSNKIFTISAKNKESAKIACNLFEENESYTIFFKTYGGRNHVVIE